MYRHARYLGCLAFISLLATTASAQFHVCELRALSRTGAQLGTEFDLDVVAGDRLNGVTNLVFSNPGITAEQKTTAALPFSDAAVGQSGKFHVRVAADVPPGRYEVRTAGRHGISNPRVFVVTKAANERVSTVSHDRQTPTELQPGQFLNAVCTVAQRDWFRFELDKPADLSIQLLAQRVDSRMIGQLRVFDSEGRSLAVARGSDDFDPEISLSKLPAGQYTVMLHDFLYRGGSEFPYQLVVGLDADAVPLLLGQADAMQEPVQGKLPGNWNPNCVSSGNAGKLMLNEVAEPAAAQRLELPSETAWWFPPDQSGQVYELSAKKGQQVAIRVLADRLGEPSDARLFVQRIEPQAEGTPKFHPIAEADDSYNIGNESLSLMTKDPVTIWTATHDADYRVIVHDMDVGQALAARQAFRLRVGPPTPGFDLIAYPAFPNKDLKQSRGFGSKLFRGSSEAIRVLALRRDGWTGPIKLTLEGLPSGVVADEVVMAANQNTAQVTLVAAENAAAGHFKVVVSGRSLDGKTTAVASPATLVWGSGGGRDFIRSRIGADLLFSVSDHDLSPLTIGLGEDAVLEVKKGAALSVPISITRREGGKEACVLRTRDLPAGVTAADVTVAADKTDGKLEIKVSDKAAPGTYSLWLQTETKIKLKPDVQPLQRAQDYRKHLQTLHDDPAQAAQLEAIKAAMGAADKQIEAAKAEAKEQQLTVFIPSPNLTFRVVDP